MTSHPRATHIHDIKWLREADQAEDQQIVDEAIERVGSIRNLLDLAADLLEMHDATGISLDNWPAARTFVEHLIGRPITENHV